MTTVASTTLEFQRLGSEGGRVKRQKIASFTDPLGFVDGEEVVIENEVLATLRRGFIFRPAPYRPPVSMAILVRVDDSPSPKKYPLKAGITCLGRHPECDIQVEEGAVSRRHAQVSLVDHNYVLEDLQSRNGTFLNGQLLQKPQALVPGDKIRICDVEMEFFDGENLSAPILPLATWQFEGSSFGVEIFDEPQGQAPSQPLSKIEVRRTNSGVQLAAPVETKLSALLEITHALGSALRLDDVFPKVLEGLFAIFPQADRGFIVMLTPDGQIVPRWAKNRRPQAEADTLRMSRTVIRQVMAEQTAICSLDASSDQRFQSSESIADFRIRSMICAPLINSQGESIGALQLDTFDHRHQFAEGDTEVLAAVAIQAGIAIHNAQLHEQALLQKASELDLKIAEKVQKAFLPQRQSDVVGFHLTNHYAAANHIGGDYFDYIPLQDGRLAVVVADVVGHGVAAAMFMAKLSAETRFALASELDPATAVTQLNARLCDLDVEQRFVTFLLIVLDPRRSDATIVNAGHMPPIIRRRDGSIEEPGEEEAGMVLGIDAEEKYTAVRTELHEGDLVALYTDGVNEAPNPSGAHFGIGEIRRLMSLGGTGEEACQRVKTAVLRHLGASAQEDDMCLVVIERIAPPTTGTVADSPTAPVVLKA